MNSSVPAESWGKISTYGHENEKRRLIGSSAVLIALSTIFVILRLVSRKLSKAGFWWDDAVIVLALILSYGLPIGNIARIKYGHDRNPSPLKADDLIEWLTANDLIKWLKNIYAFQLFYVTSVSVVKFSILLFYQRIFPIPQFKTPLLITHLVVMVFMISFFFVTVFQCTPVRLFWLWPREDSKTSPIKGKCVEIVKMLLSTGSVNAVLDFFILALPIPVLWRLKTSKLQITLLTGIFTVATFVCLVSVIRLVVLSRISAKDKTWIYTDVAIWTATEVSMGIVSACIPSLRPLVTFFLRRGRGCNPPTSSGTQFSAAPTSSTATVYPPYDNNNKNNNHNNSISSRVHLKQEKGGGDFVRLNSEAGDVLSSVASAWGHEVIVRASGGKEGPEGGEKDGDDIEMLALGRIRVKTEIILTRESRIDYLDRLY